jgi:hypothetical protein
VVGIVLLCLGLPLLIPLGIWGIRTATRQAPGQRQEYRQPAAAPFENAAPGGRQLAAAPFENPVPASRQPVPAAAAPAAAAGDVMYHYSRQGQSLGPVNFAQLQQLATSGQLSPQDLVWTKSFGQWRPASGVPGLFP